jgi:excisionase family DNA binding protein
LWAEIGELPAVKFGRQWRFEEAIFLQWVSMRAISATV